MKRMRKWLLTFTQLHCSPILAGGSRQVDLLDQHMARDAAAADGAISISSPLCAKAGRSVVRSLRREMREADGDWGSEAAGKK